MEYSGLIWSIAAFVEARIKTKIQYENLESTIGYSYRHLREIFHEYTGLSLSQYILLRRIANATVDMIRTNKKLIDIAFDYSFSSYTSFVRAFKRYLQITPSRFREQSHKICSKQLLMNLYTPAIYGFENNIVFRPLQLKLDNEPSKYNGLEESILYGVEKIEYSSYECTPFPMALKSCLNYLGQKTDYSHIMAASGASFRFRWNSNSWDGGNIDLRTIYEDQYKAFKRSFEAEGREFHLLERTKSTKRDFIELIKQEIGKGRPVIALGIIGPAEACLVTGYRDNGNTLLGWNFFQNNLEFAKDVSIDANGYFICSTWWENPSTIAVMSVGEISAGTIDDKAILSNAIDILTKEYIDIGDRIMAGGQKAYDVWIKFISDEKHFKGKLLPELFGHANCQSDAQAMISEGRIYAAKFMRYLGRKYPSTSDFAIRATNDFNLIVKYVIDMYKILGGFDQNEDTVRRFANPQIRNELVKLIRLVKKTEYSALQYMKHVLKKL